MSVDNYEELVEHIGHKIECVSYGPGDQNWNVALECMICHEVLLDFDNPKVGGENVTLEKSC